MLGVGVVLCAVLSACGGPAEVDIDSPDLDTSDERVCSELVGSLPDTLADQGTRPVTPQDALGAAWGDPAITVTCGVGVPAGFDELSDCTQADGVGWYVPESAAEDLSRDVTLTAVGYRPRVSVTVPPAYLPEGAAAAILELAAPVKDTLELVQPCR